ncbi:hypothetical protein RDWZM_008997 [Blomia tropicalis]|uniref:Phosphatidic acid phosphatase type 2/haloperoxidase domain-containing protein n=1 Tax=Blomia tropicalis TaxID=40697 RepID=A0A9Q0RKX0_BLOTA|nr:hypothetical protein BLOT_012084 [Blomia tropicalis]KAJ6217840.1 hypothetical protein RDWZM_008997 [Blomia tropicalis]
MCSQHWKTFVAFSILGIFTIIGLASRPNSTGFFCNDETIRMPYNHTQTLSLPLLFILCYVLSSIGFILNRYYFSKTQCWLLLKYDYLSFTFGFMYTIFLTLMVKIVSGRLRPHFIEFCDSTKLLNLYCVDNSNTFNEQYECINNIDLFKGSGSFFSAHSSMASFSMTYLILYIQNSLPPSIVQKSIKLLVQCMLLNITIMVGYTRIMDYYNHWEDVLVGLSFGAFVACWTHFNIAHYFQQNNNQICAIRTTSINISDREMGFLLNNDQTNVINDEPIFALPKTCIRRTSHSPEHVPLLTHVDSSQSFYQTV